jgi:hypothetical protein
VSSEIRGRQSVRAQEHKGTRARKSVRAQEIRAQGVRAAGLLCGRGVGDRGLGARIEDFGGASLTLQRH